MWSYLLHLSSVVLLACWLYFLQSMSVRVQGEAKSFSSGVGRQKKSSEPQDADVDTRSSTWLMLKVPNQWCTTHTYNKSQSQRSCKRNDDQESLQPRMPKEHTRTIPIPTTNHYHKRTRTRTEQSVSSARRTKRLQRHRLLAANDSRGTDCSRPRAVNGATQHLLQTNVGRYRCGAPSSFEIFEDST